MVRYLHFRILEFPLIQKQHDFTNENRGLHPPNMRAKSAKRNIKSIHHWLVVFIILKTYESQWGKDDIPYMKWKIKAMFETTIQNSFPKSLKILMFNWYAQADSSRSIAAVVKTTTGFSGLSMTHSPSWRCLRRSKYLAMGYHPYHPRKTHTKLQRNTTSRFSPTKITDHMYF